MTFQKQKRRKRTKKHVILQQTWWRCFYGTLYFLHQTITFAMERQLIKGGGAWAPPYRGEMLSGPLTKTTEYQCESKYQDVTSLQAVADIITRLFLLQVTWRTRTWCASCSAVRRVSVPMVSSSWRTTWRGRAASWTPSTAASAATWTSWVASSWRLAWRSSLWRSRKASPRSSCQSGWSPWSRTRNCHITSPFWKTWMSTSRLMTVWGISRIDLTGEDCMTDF